MAFQVSDIGAVVVLEICEAGAVVDVSSATVTKQIEILRPDNTTLDVAASFTTDGTDGKIQYASVSGDLNQPGTYEAQGYAVIGTWTGRTSKARFNVYANAI